MRKYQHSTAGEHKISGSEKDAFFIGPESCAYLGDQLRAELPLIDGGQFPLEQCSGVIGEQNTALVTITPQTGSVS